MAALTIYRYSMRGFVCYKQTRRAVFLPTMHSWIYLGVSRMPSMWTSSGNICRLAFGWKIALVFLSVNYMLISPDCRDGWSLNVSSIPAAERPDFLQCDIKGRISSHEYDSPALQLRRQAFSDQVATFRKILSYVFRLQGIPWAFQQSKSLPSLGGALPFCSLSWRAASTLDGITLDMLCSMQEGRTIRAFMARTFSVKTLPDPSGLPRPDVALVWRNWKSRFR